MSEAVGVELIGVSDLRRKLGKLVLELDDFDSLWDDLDIIMQQHVVTWFESEGEGTWPPLNEAYAARKYREGHGEDILVREGDLLASLLDWRRARRLGQGRSTLGTFSSKVYAWGTDDPTAEYHTEGRDDPPMPPRPPLVLTPGLLAEVDEAAGDWLEDVVRRSGLEATE